MTTQLMPIVLVNVRLECKLLQKQSPAVTRTVINQLRVGDKAELWDAANHRLWVKIERRWQHRFIGKVLAVEPAAAGPPIGSHIAFHPCNISDYAIEQTPRVPATL